MNWWTWIFSFVVVMYLLGFVLCLWFHMTELQMVTFPLALLRSLFWPVYILTGWPHGTPLRMD